MAGGLLARTRLRFAVFACLLLLTASRAHDWRSFDALADAGLARAPTPLTLGHHAWRQVERMEKTRAPEDARAVLATVDAFFRLFAEEIEGPVPARPATTLLTYRANALLDLGRPREALDACREAAGYHIADWTVHDTERAAWRRLGRPEEALAAAEAAFAIEDSPVTRVNLAEALFLLARERESTGDLAAARDLYTRSWKIFPDPTGNAPARAALDRLR